jgi:hypothetical protein
VGVEPVNGVGVAGMCVGTSEYFVLARDELHWKARKCFIHYSSPAAVGVVGCPHLHEVVYI